MMGRIQGYGVEELESSGDFWAHFPPVVSNVGFQMSTFPLQSSLQITRYPGYQTWSRANEHIVYLAINHFPTNQTKSPSEQDI
jgi:hypothetical protein